MRFALRRPSPALVIALIALFVSLGGVTYAATRAPRNSVSSSAIRSSAVTSSKIHRSAVTGSKLATGAVTGAKVADGSLTATDIDVASLGRLGAVTQRQANGTPQGVAAGAVLEQSVSCNPGEELLSGGAYASDVHMTLNQEWPTGDATWTVRYVNLTSSAIGSTQVIAFAFCAAK